MGVLVPECCPTRYRSRPAASSQKLSTTTWTTCCPSAVRTQLEQQYQVRPGDTFGLLRHIGGECAGAVQLTTGGEPQNGHLVPLSEAEVVAIVEDLPTLAAPKGETVSASLGGVQSKVLLTRTADGWAWPAAGAMSTHIIKPEPIDPSVAVPEIIEYEHWAMRLAAAAGLSVAQSELVRFGDQLALVVERTTAPAASDSTRKTSPRPSASAQATSTSRATMCRAGWHGSRPDPRGSLSTRPGSVVRCCSWSPSTSSLATATGTQRTTRCCSPTVCSPSPLPTTLPPFST